MSDLHRFLRSAGRQGSEHWKPYSHRVGVNVRLVNESDAGPLAALLSANREFLAPWEPVRTERYATESHQRYLLREALARHQTGTAVPLAIVEDGLVVGRITISDIVRGPFLSGHLGYWVAETSNGRGVATAAVAATVAMADRKSVV